MGYLKEKLLSGYPKNEEVTLRIQKIKNKTKQKGDDKDETIK